MSDFGNSEDDDTTTSNDWFGEWSDDEDQDYDDDDYSDEETKIKILSKTQKKLNRFKILICNAVNHFVNHQYIDFKIDLKEINNTIIKNKWNKPEYIMPIFYVKYMNKIYDKISELNAWNEKNKKEKVALKSLKRNAEKQIFHIEQLKLFKTKPHSWKYDDCDIGLYMNDDSHIHKLEVIFMTNRNDAQFKPFTTNYLLFGYIHTFYNGNQIFPLDMILFIKNYVFEINVLIIGDGDYETCYYDLVEYKKKKKKTFRHSYQRKAKKKAYWEWYNQWY